MNVVNFSDSAFPSFKGSLIFALAYFGKGFLVLPCHPSVRAFALSYFGKDLPSLVKACSDNINVVV